MKHHPDDLIMLFNDLFLEKWRTRLVKGDIEPEYIPASDADAHHRVIFAHGYFASALHEVSHWCIAGERRRMLHDYGYWYCPDGRTEQQQAAFEKAEIKPQALEWVFSAAAGSKFNISVDNLSGEGPADEDVFRARVSEQAQRYVVNGLPPRAALFKDALLDFYGRHAEFGPDCFRGAATGCAADKEFNHAQAPAAL
ncbi:elongation factor P hydroxylase [Marinobacter sp. BGYM27]|uniref:elongation factor P hydroxylase n=1 Tax=Marinobacter sp. BGYM27 TaxID=2975597 RepID=UPI0021A5FDCC|nr:elongation factor P hydroxylase [Marinobacter sp. BGYM27]MDG5500526.1 elongation factor P hydroxylase [Marinobacter sp. BGYM27]